MNAAAETSAIPTDFAKPRTLADMMAFDEARAEVDDISAMCLRLNQASLARLSRAKRVKALNGSFDSWVRG
jgi:hypothetical protein